MIHFLFTNHFYKYWPQCSRWVTDASLEPSKTDFPSIQPFVVPFVQQSNLCFLPIHECPYCCFLGDTSWNFSVSMKFENQYVHIHILRYHSSNVSTTPLWQWGFRQCLPFSWTTLRGKHCRHPIAVMGVVDTFGHTLLQHPMTLCKFPKSGPIA